MREKFRNSIASFLKLPQFITMNVIDGQAEQIGYTSLIFCSLTIDNILNIIILLILATVSIAILAGDNGLFTKAKKAKIESLKKQYFEEINLDILEEQVEREAETVDDIFILSLKNKIQKRTWVKSIKIEKEENGLKTEIDLTSGNLEQANLIDIITNDEYEIFVEVHNSDFTAKIRDSFLKANIEENEEDDDDEIEDESVLVGEIVLINTSSWAVPLGENSKVTGYYSNIESENYTTTISATVLPNNADNKNVIWESSNPDIVSVSTGGVLTFKDGSKVVRSVTITCKSADGNASQSFKAEVNGYKQYLFKEDNVPGVSVNNWGDCDYTSAYSSISKCWEFKHEARGSIGGAAQATINLSEYSKIGFKGKYAGQMQLHVGYGTSTFGGKGVSLSQISYTDIYSCDMESDYNESWNTYIFTDFEQEVDMPPSIGEKYIVFGSYSTDASVSWNSLYIYKDL